MKPKQNYQRSSLSFTIGWIGELRRQTNSLYDLASSIALLIDGSLPLENFDSILVNNKLSLGQEFLAAETQQLERLHNLGFLQESLPPQQTTREDATTPISLQDLTLDALARHALELQRELSSFLLQVLPQVSTHQPQGDLRLQGDLLRLNRKIRILAIHCDMVSGMDRPTDGYYSPLIATSPAVLLQMTEIAATLVGCVRHGYEPRVWKAFCGTPTLQFSVLRDNEETSNKEEIEKLKREIERLKKKDEWNAKDIETLKEEIERLKQSTEGSQQKIDATEQLSRAFNEVVNSCLTVKDLARLVKIKPPSISTRVAALAKRKWLYPSLKGKERCFSFAEGRVIINNPSYENPGVPIT